MIERYSNDKAAKIWSEKSKLDKWLQIEKEHVTTLYYNKEITHFEYDQIIKNLPDEISDDHIEKWKMIEKSTKHDGIRSSFVSFLLVEWTGRRRHCHDVKFQKERKKMKSKHQTKRCES